MKRTRCRETMKTTMENYSGNEEDDSSPVLYPQKQIQITIQ